MTNKPFVPTLTEGMVRKGGHNTGPSAVKTRPPPPGPMRVFTQSPDAPPPMSPALEARIRAEVEARIRVELDKGSRSVGKKPS